LIFDFKMLISIGRLIITYQRKAFNRNVCYNYATNMKFLSLLLMFCLITTAAFAGTGEAASHNFWQEFDITFWQTLPFAALWGHFADRQISTYVAPGSSVHWEIILGVGVGLSALNAYLQAKRVLKNERAGSSN